MFVRQLPILHTVGQVFNDLLVDFFDRGAGQLCGRAGQRQGHTEGFFIAFVGLLIEVDEVVVGQAAQSEQFCLHHSQLRRHFAVIVQILDDEIVGGSNDFVEQSPKETSTSIRGLAVFQIIIEAKVMVLGLHHVFAHKIGGEIDRFQAEVVVSRVRHEVLDLKGLIDGLQFGPDDTWQCRGVAGEGILLFLRDVGRLIFVQIVR